MKTDNKTKAFAFLGAAFVLLIALLFTACPNVAGGSGSGSGGTTPQAPLVTGGASLILKPGTSTFKVSVATADGTPVTVEGCTETSLARYTETTLHAQGTTVILKGNITYLDCSGSSSGSTVTDNGVIALNVQVIRYHKSADLKTRKIKEGKIWSSTVKNLKNRHYYCRMR